MNLFLLHQGQAYVQGQFIDPGRPFGLLAKIIAAAPNLQAHFLVIVFEVLLCIGIGPADLDDNPGIRQNRG